MRRKKLIDKQAFKKMEGRCFFCEESDYNLLDVHRILEGSEKGQYTNTNSLVVCCKCHRKIHAGYIKPIRKYLRSDGLWVLNYIDENEQEQWVAPKRN
jgi:hypothetical protein